jgi:hypothetical protein
MIFAASLGAISLVIKGLDKISRHAIEVVHAMALLVDRFVVFPQELLYYTFSKLYKFCVVYLPWLSESLPLNMILEKMSKKMDRAKTTAILIDGRIDTDMEIVDNGYLAMLHDGGWTALVLWIFLWAVLIVLGFKSLRKSPGVNSAYAVSLVIGCAFSAVTMRAFQVFPFWVMIAMAIGINLSWFMDVLQCDKLPQKNRSPESTRSHCHGN